jgi:hypothetical protein
MRHRADFSGIADEEAVPAVPATSSIKDGIDGAFDVSVERSGITWPGADVQLAGNAT